MRVRVLLLAAVVPLSCAAASCDDTKKPGRPVPTPGPQIEVVERAGRHPPPAVERGERVRFAVIGTGTGTHFDEQTFLHSPAFAELRVVAVESSARLHAQGVVSLVAAEGNKDLAAVSGDELAVSPWAFRVIPTTVVDLGPVPCDSDGRGGDANVLDPPGDFDVYVLRPPTDAIRTLLVRVDLAGDAATAFTPSLELYRADGRLAAASDHGCASLAVRSRDPVYARVSDPNGAGGATHRYRIAADFGLPDACLAGNPGGLPPAIGP